ncbi:MAG: glycosyltransferase [Planctomycetota bacterium]
MVRNSKKMDVICFGGGDWWYHNRAHIDMQLMRRFAKNGTVLYVNSVVIQKVKLTKGGSFAAKFVRKARSIMRGLRSSGEGFWVYSPVTLPIHHISWVSSLNEFFLRTQVKSVMRKLNMHKPLVWVACPGACDTSMRLNKCKLIWQRTDRWEEFPNVDADTIKRYDRKLKANADLTVFVSSLLYKEESKQCKKALYLDHGVDYAMFAYAHKDDYIPADIGSIHKPIAGFFGGIDAHTSDIGFLTDVIKLLPEISFVLIGSVSLGRSELASRKNVFMLGQKPYRQIPHYGKCFDVAIMPWRQNRWIQACNPVKLKEYLALGKPVVSTPFAELGKYKGLVYEAKTPSEFAECIKKALEQNSPERIAARRKRIESSTWDSKAALVLQEIVAEPDDSLLVSENHSMRSVVRGRETL